MQIRYNKSKIKKFFTKSTAIKILILIIALSGLNYLANQYFVRIDLTQSKQYTLSKGSKEILADLADKVTFEVYFSDNITASYRPVRRDALDLLQEYVRYGKGQVELVQKNPKDQDFDSSASQAGLPKVPFGERSSDKVEIAEGYLGFVIKYKDSSEIIQFVSSTNNLEYDITSKIYKLTSDSKINIGFLTGHGEKSIFTDYTNLKSLLESQYSVQSVDLSTGKPIDSSKITTLIIAAPTQKFSERDLFELDQYILSGGKVIVLADNYSNDFEQLVLVDNKDNLNQLLKNYGITVNGQVLSDESFTPLQNSGIPIAYPYWVQAISQNIKTDLPPLNVLQSLTFYWANTITSTNPNTEYLVKSTERAWVEEGDNININVRNFVPSETRGQQNIAVLVQGAATSAYKGQDIPKLANKKAKDERTSKDKRINAADQIKLTVIADSDFISDSFIQGNEQNAVFMLNLVDWLSSAEKLSAIRSKNIETRPLTNLNETAKNTFKFFAIMTSPIAFVSLGVVYNLMRKNKKSFV